MALSNNIKEWNASVFIFEYIVSFKKPVSDYNMIEQPNKHIQLEKNGFIFANVKKVKVQKTYQSSIQGTYFSVMYHVD